MQKMDACGLLSTANRIHSRELRSCATLEQMRAEKKEKCLQCIYISITEPRRISFIMLCYELHSFDTVATRICHVHVLMDVCSLLFKAKFIPPR